MTIFPRQALARCLSVSTMNVVLPKLLSQSFNLLTPEKRNTHPTSLNVLLLPCLLCLAFSRFFFALAMCSSAENSLILSHPIFSPPPLFLFSLSSLSVLCRIPICLSGDTNWKIAWGFPWAATPTGPLLISGNLRKLVKRVVTFPLSICPPEPYFVLVNTRRTVEGVCGGWVLCFNSEGANPSRGLRLASGSDNSSSVQQHVNSLAGAILSILCKCLEVAMLNLWRRAGSVSCCVWI